MSIGDVIGQPPSSTFWDASTNVELFYGLSGRCNNCTGETLIEYNTNTGFYDVTGSGKCVHEILSAESIKQQYGMVWTEQLDLDDKIIVIINGLINKHFNVVAGTKLGDVGDLSSYFDDGLHEFVSGECDTRVVYNSSHIVTKSVELRLGLIVDVFVGSPINENKRMVVGDTLQQLSCSFEFSLDDFIVVDSNTSNILNKSSMIETSMTIKLCHNVTVSGLLNESFVIEHGMKLSQIGKFSGYFAPQFIIYDIKNKTLVFTDDMVVESNIQCVISNTTKQEISIRFDDSTNPSVDDIKDAINRMLEFGDDDHVWIEVIAQDDGSFVVSVIQSGEQTNDVADALRDCSNSHS